MRIGLNKIAPELKVSIKGDEAWLMPVYQEFPVESGAVPQLSGELKLTVQGGGSVRVTGDVDYAPLVNCGRCGTLMAWPMHLAVDVRFLPEAFNDAPREKNLTRDELDAYYLSEGEVDLEQLLTDLILTELPTTLVRTDDDHECVPTSDESDEPQIYGSHDGPHEEAPPSPFAALKGLKLKS